MNLDTVREMIQLETSRKSAADDQNVVRAIAGVCRKHYRKKFRFNTVTIELKLNGEFTERSPDPSLNEITTGIPPDEVTTYYFPKDLLRSIRMSRLEWSPNVPIDEYTSLELSRRWSQTVSGIPRGMAWDGSDRFQIRPVVEPSYQVDFNYIRDIARPVLVVEEGRFILRDSITNEKFDGDTQSPWFDEAQDLTVYGSCYRLFMGTYGDSEKATRYRQLETEARRELEGYDAMMTGPRSARAHY